MAVQMLEGSVRDWPALPGTWSLISGQNSPIWAPLHHHHTNTPVPPWLEEGGQELGSGWGERTATEVYAHPQRLGEPSAAAAGTCPGTAASLRRCS